MYAVLPRLRIVATTLAQSGVGLGECNSLHRLLVSVWLCSDWLWISLMIVAAVYEATVQRSGGPQLPSWGGGFHSNPLNPPPSWLRAWILSWHQTCLLLAQLLSSSRHQCSIMHLLIVFYLFSAAVFSVSLIDKSVTFQSKLYSLYRLPFQTLLTIFCILVLCPLSNLCWHSSMYLADMPPWHVALACIAIVWSLLS